MSTAEEVRQSLLALDPGTRYSIRVRSVDGLGNKSDWSEAMEFDTTASSALPLPVTRFDYEWKGRDLHLTWIPTTKNTAGTPVDIAYYEVVPVTDLVPPSTLIAGNRYASGSTSFTYSAEMNIADFGNYSSNVPLVIVAVDKNGLKSAFEYSALVVANHPDPDTPPAPKVYDVGGQLLVQMDRGTDCFLNFELYYSSDGGSTFSSVPGSPTGEIYIFTPASGETHYFKYKIRCIYGLYSEFSSTGYGSTSVDPAGPTVQTVVDRYDDFTVSADDIGTMQRGMVGISVHLPSDVSESIPIGSRVDFLRWSSSNMTFSTDGGSSVRAASTEEPYRCREQFSVCSAEKVDNDEWVIFGDLLI